MPKWTEEEKAVVCQLYPTMTAKEIAPLVGRTPRAVHLLARELKVNKVVHAPRFVRPIGSERMDRGHLIRKVTNTGQPKKDWKRVDVIEWEAMNGPLPRGMTLVVKEADQPPGPSNLMLLPRKKLLALSRSDGALPLGSERVRDGTLRRKVAMTGDRDTDWKRVDVLLWESAHGPIPPGYTLMVLDSSKPRTLDNLKLFTMAEHMRRASVNNLPPELLELYQLKARINHHINAMERKAASEKSEAT